MSKTTKPLGEKLRDQAEKRQRDALAYDLERRRAQEKQLRAEAEVWFAEIVKELPKRLQTAAKNGNTSLQVFTGSYAYSPVESVVSWMLQSWAIRNKFDSYRTQHKMDEGGATPDSLTISWAPKKINSWI